MFTKFKIKNIRSKKQLHQSLRADFTLILRKGLALKARKGFTLIELVISIAIIGLLIALLIPNIDRSLSRNNIVTEVDLLKAKIEETRLMAGSTQQLDNGTGYYGIYLPAGDNSYFTIVRLTVGTDQKFSAPCTVEIAIAESQSGSSEGNVCLVERVALSKSIILRNQAGGDKLIIYKAPTQQISEAKLNGQVWEAGTPDFNWGNNLQLQSPSKTATVTIESYTGKVSVIYS